MELLIRQLRMLDSIEKKGSFPDGFSLDNYRHMAGYESRNLISTKHSEGFQEIRV